MNDYRLSIAIQKSGRLHDASLALLKRCGLSVRISKNQLFCQGENLPIDILLVRDDDIPTLVADEVCDLGIVGENVLYEKMPAEKKSSEGVKIVMPLGFGQCNLALAVANESEVNTPEQVSGFTFATSYPNLLQQYADKNKLDINIVELAGAVEIAPRLGVAEGICDLVSTGETLAANHLRKIATVLESQAVLIQRNTPLASSKIACFELLKTRINGVMDVKDSKYILFHAPKDALSEIKGLLPGSEMPTVLPLEGDPKKVAVHVVSREGVFWETLEQLKSAGASSILVLPIEKMLV